MIYNFFLLTEETILTRWSQPNFPKMTEIEGIEEINEERLKHLVSLLNPSNRKSAFNSIDVDSITLTFLHIEDVAYIIVSDKADPEKARRSLLKEIAGEINPHVNKLKEGKTLENFNEFMERKTSSHTRSLAGPRSRTGSSVALGIIGGLIFILAFSWVGKLLGSQWVPTSGVSPLLWLIEETFNPLATLLYDLFPITSKGWLLYLIFFVIFAILTGLFAGLASGKSTGGFVGAYLSVMLTFLLPILESYEEITIPFSGIEEYYPILTVSSKVLESEPLKLLGSWQTVFIIGVSFALLSAVMGAVLSGFIDGRSLVAPQLSIKPRKKPRKGEKKKTEKKIEEAEAEEEERVEIEETELEELEDLFGR